MKSWMRELLTMLVPVAMWVALGLSEVPAAALSEPAFVSASHDGRIRAEHAGDPRTGP